MSAFTHDVWQRPALTLETDASGGLAPILAGRRAVVTGGGKGIGRGISSRLARAGAEVLICGSGNMDMAYAARDEILERGGRAYCLQADLSESGGPEAVAREARRLFGGLDILVNNAAYQPNLDITEYTHSLFEKVLAIDLYAQMELISLCLPMLRESSEGRIVNIGSVHSKRPTGFDIGYATAKGGVLMLTREAACELHGTSVTCNCILPGATLIEFKSGETHRLHTEPRQRERTDFLAPVRGLPEDTGDLCVYLCSRMGRHINGCAIRTDGGNIML